MPISTSATWRAGPRCTPQPAAAPCPWQSKSFLFQLTRRSSPPWEALSLSLSPQTEEKVSDERHKVAFLRVRFLGVDRPSLHPHVNVAKEQHICFPLSSKLPSYCQSGSIVALALICLNGSTHFAEKLIKCLIGKVNKDIHLVVRSAGGKQASKQATSIGRCWRHGAPRRETAEWSFCWGWNVASGRGEGL